jgi:uncharacterized protein (DUF1697 family)
MALVVLLRGINVGGHRRFRPSTLARQLEHLGLVNIGAAGTFVVRQAIAPAKLRVEFARRLPFDAGIAICASRDVWRALERHPLAHQSARSDVVRFVSVLTDRRRAKPPIPLTLPPSGRWLLKILAREGRFVFGVYRRDMKVIGYLGAIDRLFGVPAITRNWNTLTAVARVLDAS